MIQAKIVTDSINEFGNRATTMEVIMPRYILAEFNTHRMLSKNSASSRAIPIKKMLTSVIQNGFKPYAWQKEHKGMQGAEYHEDIDKIREIENFFEAAKDEALTYCSLLNDELVTKQLANRLLEPFMYHKVLVTGTDWDNFFNLRCPEYNINGDIFKSRKEAILKYPTDKDLTILDWLKCNQGQADIHMMFLAEAMYDAMNESIPVQLKAGEWHLPYGDNIDLYEINVIKDFKGSFQEARIKISTARCARLSYQTLGDNPVIDYEKDIALDDKFITSWPIHASPMEHPMVAMTQVEYFNHEKVYLTNDFSQKIKNDVDKGITIISQVGGMNGYKFRVKEFGWSRNVRGFIQRRALLGL